MPMSSKYFPSGFKEIFKNTFYSKITILNKDSSNLTRKISTNHVPIPSTITIRRIREHKEISSSLRNNFG